MEESGGPRLRESSAQAPSTDVSEYRSPVVPCSQTLFVRYFGGSFHRVGGPHEIGGDEQGGVVAERRRRRTRWTNTVGA